ncbi:MAG TPA: acyltransferase [Puia sp.]
MNPKFTEITPANILMTLDFHLQSRKKNNFNLLRLLASLLVILSHCLGNKDPFFALSGGGFYGTNIALPAFFFLSGLLVAQSRERTPSILRFAQKRLLRLYPAACFVILAWALVLGPLLTTLPPAAYFTHPLFFQYLLSCSLIRIYYQLPGLFTHSPLGPSVNASLWSLSLELKLYALLLLISLLPKKSRLPLLLSITAGLILATFFFSVPAITHLIIYFLTGMLTYHYRTRIFPSHYWLLPLLAGWWCSFQFHLSEPLFYFLLPLTTLYLSTSGTSRIPTPKPDFSYGFYCWGYPINQLIVNYLNPTPDYRTLLLTLLITLPMAAFSWYFIEQPFLRLKNDYLPPYNDKRPPPNLSDSGAASPDL